MIHPSVPHTTLLVITDLQSIMPRIAVELLSRFIALHLLISRSLPFSGKQAAYLEDNYESSVPLRVPLHIRQVEWRVQRSSSLRRRDGQLRMFCVQIEERPCSTAFFFSADVRSESEARNARHWSVRGAGAGGHA